MSVRAQAALQPELSLPPPFTAVRLRESGDAFAHAMSIAGKEGAGTLVYVGRFDLAEFALVLEPEEPLVSARRAFYAGMVAVADALTAHAKPETAINIDWPDSIAVNYGFVGGGRLGWPARAKEEEVPDWLVFGASIRTASAPDFEPGVNPQITALDEEGFTEVLSTHVIESFARNFMVALDAWHESGFSTVTKSYMQRLATKPGLRRDIDKNGDLLLRQNGDSAPERLALLPRLRKPSWLDPKTQGPRT